MTTKKIKKVENLLSQNKIQFFYPYPSARSANDPKYNFLQLKFEKKNSQSTLNNFAQDETSPKKNETSNQKLMHLYQSCSNSNLTKLEHSKQEQSQRKISPKTFRDPKLQEDINNSENKTKNEKQQKTKDQVLGKILSPGDLQTKLNQYFKVYQQLINNSQQQNEPEKKAKSQKKQLTINPQEIEQSYNKEKDRPLSNKNPGPSWKPDLGINTKLQKNRKSELYTSQKENTNSKNNHLLSPDSDTTNMKVHKSQCIDSKKSTVTSTTPRQNQILALSQSHQFLDLSSPNRETVKNSGSKAQKIVRNNNYLQQPASNQQPQQKTKSDSIKKNEHLKQSIKKIQNDENSSKSDKKKFLQEKPNSCKNSSKKCIDFSTRDTSKCQECLTAIMQRTKLMLENYVQKEKTWKREKQILLSEIQRLNKIIQSKDLQQ